MSLVLRPAVSMETGLAAAVQGVSLRLVRPALPITRFWSGFGQVLVRWAGLSLQSVARAPSAAGHSNI